MIEFIKFCFLFPGWIVLFLFNILSSLVTGKDLEDQTNKEIPESMVTFSVFFWIIIGGWLLYESQYNKITYVYACPDSGGSKCYNLRADYDPEFGYTEIYFNNGGYITFESCTIVSKTTRCYADDSKDGVWEIKFDRIEKVKK